MIFTCALAASATIAASWVKRPQRVVGFGILPPMSEPGTIELARGLRTDDLHWQQRRNSGAAQIARWWKWVTAQDWYRARVICCLINKDFSAVRERRCFRTRD